MTRTSDDITSHLQGWAEGDRQALEALMPRVYAELRRCAARQLRRERPDHTLQPTALVHEAYVKLAGQHRPDWRNRSQFFAVASQTMRRVLVDQARRRHAVKRQAFAVAVQLDDENTPGFARAVEIERLDMALSELQKRYPRQAHIVEMRYFGGLTLQETADALGVSIATVKNDWTRAKAWLFSELYET